MRLVYVVLVLTLVATVALAAPRSPVLVGGCAGTRYGCCPDGVTSNPPPGSNAVCPPVVSVGGNAGPGYSIVTGH